ncbi:hypothetical protein N7532_002845 [Penicillium argentinense]|uniref:Signal peptide peptidase n=1 Tax=Penicillium argentinense TaxID=1131581 RepID=A0A9W9G157_9EURO|nr:uncharacterized protein N7532_002845 [Penicillium argentinense]KAJ5110200.1 hypothetical protein N7532_002845 [Penicillium argentinense]
MSEVQDISPVAELLGHALYHYERMRPLLPTYGHLLVASLFPIWIGAHASLARPTSAAKPPKKKDGGKEDDTADEDDEDHKNKPKLEGLEAKDALMFPLTAGITLCGLYLVIKWLGDAAILNKILGYYFSLMGVFFAVAFLKDFLLIVRSFIFPRYYRSGGKLWRANQAERVFRADDEVRHSPLPGLFGRIPMPAGIRVLLWSSRNAAYQRLKLRVLVRGIIDGKGLVGLLDLLSGIVGIGTVGYFAFVTKPWWLTNFFGFSFSYGAVQFMSPVSFWVGSCILGSLFFYDIYFVFFTPIMVTVATKLDVPIKLLFPRPAGPKDDPGVQALAMLGLGDIVVPGMMVALALRFDLFLYYQRKGQQKAHAEGTESIVKPEYQPATGFWGERFWAPTITPREPEFQPPYYDARSFPKTYFTAGIIGYVLGMISTLLAMQYSDHAQPALLYLVPGVLISLWGTAFLKGDLRAMSDFSDADEDEDEDEGKDESKEGGESAKKADEKNKNESTHEHKGLFMRILSGDFNVFKDAPKDSSSKGDSKEETEEAAEDSGRAAASDDFKQTDSKKSQSENKKSKKKKKEDSDLVLFSISFPRKSKSKKQESFNDKSSEDEVVFIPGVGEWGEEPPMKRRRGTPRKQSTSS